MVHEGCEVWVMIKSFKYLYCTGEVQITTKTLLMKVFLPFK